MARRAPARLAVALCLLVRGGDCHCRGLDRMALIKLYEGLDGASWVNNNNWNTSSGTSAQNKANDPCTVGKRWFGVGFIDPCDPYMDDIIGEGPATDYLTAIRGSGQGCFAGRITSLNLRRNGLKGNLSSIAELGDLGNLTYLDLSWNEIIGDIPTQIGRISNVQVINLAHNSLEGILPTELGELNANGPPAATGCGTDDPCPVGVQLKMYDLNAGFNSLTGSIPSQLGQLSHLKILDLTYNNLTSSVPFELGNLEQLQVLYLRQNNLGGSLPDGFFQNMTELRYVMLQQNSLSGGVPTEVGKLVKLNTLHMYTNKLDVALPDEIGDMENLRDIRLQDNQIPGYIPESIGKLFKLRHLDFYNNAMLGDIPASIKNLTNLKALYVQNEHLTPVRQRYCRQRIPNVGKYNWRLMREEYQRFTFVMCPDMHDTDYTFNSLQASGSLDAIS